MDSFDKNQALILWLDQVNLDDVALVGGKNASLGEMYQNLTPMGIKVPNGFAVTAAAYRAFIGHHDLAEKIKELLDDLDVDNVRELAKVGETIRNMILAEDLPEDLRSAIGEAYYHLGLQYGENPDVAVRSSATAEDLPDASFAGQQETYLNINGVEALTQAVKSCFASLFTNRAISYRVHKGFSHEDVALSVTVQKMVRSDLASSGVAFSIDTENGFPHTVVINGSWGLGETVVQGQVTPDEFVVFKPTLKEGYHAILSKTLGRKEVKMIYDKANVKTKKTDKAESNSWSLSDDEILQLAHWVVDIENYFSAKRQQPVPMDVEWAKDGQSGELFIVQARPETVHASRDQDVIKEYQLKESGEKLVTGVAVGGKIATGPIRVIKNASEISKFKPGEILVTEMTDPDWEPIMKIAGGIITDKGGRTSHAAIVSRELGTSCIVGTGDATTVLETGQEVTIDCASQEEGAVYAGKLDFSVKERKLGDFPNIETNLMLNVGSPAEAFRWHYLPVSGVGLGRLEFIISSYIKVHPKALLNYENLVNSKVREEARVAKKITDLTVEHDNKIDHYINELAEGIAKIAASAWPNPAIIRLSDFKTNEYRTLIGGELYEPEEENPMLGWRGASRYVHPDFKEAFGLECAAILKVRDKIGLSNVIPMVPFCRTPEEGRSVVEVMAEHGLDREKDPSLKIYVMAEIPSNIFEADEFLNIFDGMSIGSNDLNQLALGLDRDSGLISYIANENNPTLKEMVSWVIKTCRERGKYIGICGQAPSDYPEFAQFLVSEGINSMSLNPDAVLPTLESLAELEGDNNENIDHA